MSGRIRTIKPEWLEDERLCFASIPARMLSVALMLLADDFGRGRAHPRWVQGQVFPGERDPGLAERYLKELADLKFILLYQVDGQSYFAIRNWDKHQKVDHPGKPRVPAPLDNPPESLAKVPESLASPSESLAPHTSDQDHDHDQDLPHVGESLALEPTAPPSPKPKRERAAPTEPHPVVTAHYFAEFERIRGFKPAFEKRDGKAIKRILERYGGDVERAKRVITHGLSAELGNPQTILTIANDPDKWLSPPPKPFKAGGRQGPPQPNSGANPFHEIPEGF